MGELKRLLENCLEQIVNDRYALSDVEPEEVEECWCYDEVDGAPDAPRPTGCLVCRLRQAISGNDSTRLQAQAEMSAALEGAVTGAPLLGVYPNWVYAARDAIKHQNEKLPWLPDLLEALGWQGGTVHEALNAVRRLVESDKRRGGNDSTRAAIKELLDLWPLSGYELEAYMAATFIPAVRGGGG